MNAKKPPTKEEFIIKTIQDVYNITPEEKVATILHQQGIISTDLNNIELEDTKKIPVQNAMRDWEIKMSQVSLP